MSRAILPGATIGILGGGQLGRMTALAARDMGYKLRALDPDAACAARYVVEELVVGSFDDPDAAERLARGSDVVTLEIEKIAPASLDRAATIAPVRPGRRVLEIVQDRAAQKQFLAARGIPVGPFRVVASEAELAAALSALGGVCFVKAARGGYDGRGQVETKTPADAAQAWRDLGGAPSVVEQALAIDCELSVLVARRPSGEIAVYPAAQNHHESRILSWSVLPALEGAPVVGRAIEVARATAEAFALEGLLCVEMFVVGRDVLVNEVAPRPHNSYHASSVACETSQFEQLVRAVCDLPLGGVRVVRPAAIFNLLGDLWSGGDAPPFERALALPGVRLFLYGKEPRPGRKMGHLTASANTAEEAVAQVLRARDILRGAPGA